MLIEFIKYKWTTLTITEKQTIFLLIGILLTSIVSFAFKIIFGIKYFEAFIFTLVGISFVFLALVIYVALYYLLKAIKNIISEYKDYKNKWREN